VEAVILAKPARHVLLETSAVDSSRQEEPKLAEYLDRIDRIAARSAGESALVETLPEPTRRVLDPGCGPGRATALVLSVRSTVEETIGLDSSPPMLDRVSQRFVDDARVDLREHDLAQPLPPLGGFDLVVSAFAIHRLTHDRKRSLFVEIAGLLRPGGVVVNLEVVQCPTPELHEEFNRRIGRPGGEPEDILAEAEPQLTWMRNAGLVHVDCNWRWRDFALLVVRAPSDGQVHA